MRRVWLLSCCASLAILGQAACGSSPTTAARPDAGSDGSLRISDVPLAGATHEELAAFASGDALFELPERPADGLGPLYTSDNCAACHRSAARGPGLVEKMSLVEADGTTPAVDQSALAFGHTVHPFVVAPATTPIEPPAGVSGVKVSARVGPPLFGRGYIEAVADASIEQNFDLQIARGTSVHGRINRVRYASEANPDQRFFAYQKGDPVIGRFGIKARIATLDDFTADALAFDMGMTSPLRPEEFPNPDGLVDDQKPGVDSSASSVNARAMYLRLLAIPERSSGHERGSALFEQAQCALCHVPSLRTRPDYPIAALADIEAPIYSDLLLHDMGKALSDGMADGVDGQASADDQRTAPLIGLRFNHLFLHDGRAENVREAILMHEGLESEANDSVARFVALSDVDQGFLVEFVSSL